MTRSPPLFHPKRFDRAAATYEANSEIQNSMADSLIKLAPPEGINEGGIIEFGCGTGLLTRKLHSLFPNSRILATDASLRMLETSQEILGQENPKINYACFDASGLGDPAPVPFSLAASNALVQWFPDLGPHFRMVAGMLLPKGCYLVSGFTSENFPELNAILRRAPFAYTDFPGNTEAGIRGKAEAAGFKVEELVFEIVERRFPNPRDFLHSIQLLGSARKPEGGNPLTRSKLAQLVAEYQQRYHDEKGVRVTWTPWFARLRLAG